jgi:membrane fusion protein (multidrug efflux system)
MTHVRIGAVVVLLAALACNMQRSGGQERESGEAHKPPTAVEAILVRRGVLSRDIVASGVATGIREAYVVSQTQGTIERVAFSLGQWVRKGQVLVEVGNSVQEAAYEQAKKSVATAAINLRAVQKLYDQGNASEAELTQAQSQATGAQAGLKQAKEAYENTRIAAPLSGYIAQKELTIAKGNVLTGGTLITRVVNISSLKSEISVGEMEVTLLRTGLKASVKVPAAGHTTFEGRVQAIGAGANPATGSYPVEITWKNDKKRTVKSGMTVRVRIETETPDSVITVPLAAISDVDRKDAAFVSVQGKAAVRFVEPGRVVGNMVEVIRGLEVGDTLLTTGLSTMSRGDTLAVTLTMPGGGDE